VNAAGSLIANSLADSPNAGVAKKETMGFRPTEDEKRLVEAAQDATGLSDSDLLRECVHKGILIVVQSVKQAREEAVRKVEQILEETTHPAAPAPPPIGAKTSYLKSKPRSNKPTPPKSPPDKPT
jgi:hypothetical protein